VIPVLDQLLDRSGLARAGFTSFLALTYGADLPWFEHHLGQQLRLAGVRRFLILADGATLDATLPQNLADAPGAGSWYAVESMRAAGAFHPKAYLLAGPRAARLYVGSGNLTQSGLGRNLELFERWDAGFDGNGLPEPMASFGRLVYGVVRSRHVTAPHVREILDAIFGEPIFGQPVRAEPLVALGTPSEVMPALAAPTAAASLTLTAPYLDADGEQAVLLARRLRAKSFSVLLDLGMTNLTPAGRQAIENAGGRIRFFDEDRRCHAKALHASGEGWQLAVHGSANLSRAAWTGHNVELVVLHRGDAATAVKDALAERTTREPEPEDWTALQATQEAAPGEAPPSPRPALALEGARWAGVAAIELSPAHDPPAGIRVRLRGADAEHVLDLGTPEGSRFRVRVPLELDRRTSCGVRLEAGGDVGAWVIAHDPDELRFQSRGRSSIDSRAEAYLSGSRGEGELTRDFLDFLIVMNEERDTEGSRGGHESPRSPAPAKPDWAWVREADFAAEVELNDEPGASEQATGDPENLGATRLLHRLLFGDRTTSESGPELNGDLAGTDADAEAKEATLKGKVRPARTVERAGSIEKDLHDLTARATAAFVSRLRRTPDLDSPERILRSLLVLAAAIQDAARAGHIRDRALGEHLIRLVGEVLGRPEAPLPRALAAIAPEERKEAWARTPYLTAACLALYNACVVTAVARDESPDSARFTDYRVVLWARHVLRHAPSLDPAALAQEIAARVPSLRRFGVLWVADRWEFEALVPFEEFVETLVRDTADIEAAEHALSSVRARMGSGSATGTEDDVVVGFGRDGRIAPGFAQEDEDPVLFDGAFQSPDAVDLSRRAYQSAVTVASFDDALALLPDLPESALRGFNLLRALA